MSEDQTRATDFVAAWVTANRGELGGKDHKSKWREGYSRTFCAEFETSKYLIQLCAWDHACCLDIQALNKATGADDYIVAGDCDGVTGLAQRLGDFLDWLDVNEPNRVA